MVLRELAPLVNAQHGTFYINRKSNAEDEPILKLIASYAYKERKNLASRSTTAKAGRPVRTREGEHPAHQVPADYIRINSGLGEAPPLNIVVLPVLFEGR